MAEFAPDSSQTRRLLEQAHAGNGKAFAELFDRHRDSLRLMIEARIDPRLRPRLDPSDVVQETHLEAFRRLPDYLARQPMPFSLWLRKTAYERLLNLRRDHVRAARRSVSREMPLPDHSSFHLAQRLLAAGSSPSRQLARRELAGQMRRALARLTEEDREMLLLRYFDNLSNQEISQLLDISPGTSSKRHGRAILRLNKILLDMGIGDCEL